ncbi:Imm49 family immunity protein [Alkalimarinus coralli]|uniref:Imm49 family immunity protein n=1 Tax=Alkalimarinus coralli TaxID=2935863 RepID=UPI00202B3994|nr:Imm49 family immunity protein [Alkalimarinus coralli]
MKKADQEDIDYWIEGDLKTIRQSEDDYKSGWYKEQDISLQSVYSGTAMDYAGLGRARFLNGESPERFRYEFSTAGKCMLKCFKMAYDVTDPDYVGDTSPPPKAPSAGYGQVNWAAVMETNAIDGFNYALMGADFETARALAYWYQDSKDGKKMDAVVNRYTYAYKHALLNELQKGQRLLEKTLQEYAEKPPKTGGDMHYFTLSMTLYGILKRDEVVFNEGLALQLKFYKKSYIPAEDLWGTAEEFICDYAVALSNLALDAGLRVTVEHDLLPKGLLIGGLNKSQEEG